MPGPRYPHYPLELGLWGWFCRVPKNLLALPVLTHSTPRSTLWYPGPAYLHGADAQAPVDDELGEAGRSLVAVPPVDHEESAQVLELSHREVRSQRCLFPFLSTNNMVVEFLRHSEIHLEKVSKGLW